MLLEGYHFCWCMNWHLGFNVSAKMNKAWLHKDLTNLSLASNAKLAKSKKNQIGSQEVPGSISTGGTVFYWTYFSLLYASLYCQLCQLCIIMEKTPLTSHTAKTLGSASKMYHLLLLNTTFVTSLSGDVMLSEAENYTVLKYGFLKFMPIFSIIITYIAVLRQWK